MTLFALFFLIAFSLISGFLSLSQVSLFSLGATDLKGGNYQKCVILLKKPRDLLVTLLFSDIFANIMIQNSAANLFGKSSNWGLIVGVPLLLSLVIGEVVPKTIALSFNRQIAPHVAPLISFLQLILAPLRSLITTIVAKISHALFFFLKENKQTSDEELRFLLSKSEESKILDKEESNWIKGYLFLASHTVKECMRPRDEIPYFELNSPLTHLPSAFKEKQHFQLPVCQKDLQNISGILTAETYFAHRDQITQSRDLLSFLKKPLYVPKTLKLCTLLNLFLSQNESLAFIVDEYGSISGLATAKDLYKLIIGKSQQQSDLRYTRSADDAIIASGKLELSEFATLFEEPLPTENKMVTLGGWLIEQLGEIPKSGTTYTWKNFLFQVLASEPNRIKDVYVRRLSR